MRPPPLLINDIMSLFDDVSQARHGILLISRRITAAASNYYARLGGHLRQLHFASRSLAMMLCH